MLGYLNPLTLFSALGAIILYLTELRLFVLNVTSFVTQASFLVSNELEYLSIKEVRNVLILLVIIKEFFQTVYDLLSYRKVVANLL